MRFGNGTAIAIAEDETIRTEISTKYDRPKIQELFSRAGLAVERWVEDSRGYYALVLAGPADA